MREAVLVFGWLALLLGAEPVLQRDAPAVIYALGDVHGDYGRLIRLLRAAGVIDAHSGWSAGASVLVVTGDMIDKGPRPVEVVRFLVSLRSAAQRSGGQVVLLAGNHELEFLAGPDKKKAQDFLEDLKRHEIDAGDVVACRADIGEALCSLPFAARIGDWFFSHAGNSAGRSIEQLGSGSSRQELIQPDSILEARLGEGNKWIAIPGKTERELLSSYVAALGVKHIVQGHQPNKVTFEDGVERHAGEMFQRLGLLFLIDTGMSRGVGYSAGALLEIRGGTASAICPNGLRSVIWNEQTNASTGRAAPCTQ